MRAWNMSKLLMEHCNSAEEVGELLATLNDPVALQEVRSMLSAFSNGTPVSSEPDDEDQMTGGKGRGASGHKTKQPGTAKNPEIRLSTSKVAATDQLESLFRSREMTNRQVEQWINSKFDVNVVMGKGSLRQYLTKVLNKADLGMSNRMLSAAQRLVMDGSSGDSDIRNYWDELDKRHTFAE